MNLENSDNKPIQTLTKIGVWIPLMLLFASYPLALFIPLGKGMNIFDFGLPTFTICSSICMGLLIFSRRGLPTKIRPYFWLSLFLILLSGYYNQSPLSWIIHSLGFVLVPLLLLFIGTASKNSPLYREYFSRAAALLWIVNIFHSYSAYPAINKIGISGNQNWFSALLLASVPFAVLQIKKCLSLKIADKKALVISAVIVIALSFLPLKTADSRASFVALGLLLPYLFFIKSSAKVRVWISLVTLSIILISLFTFKEKLAWENTRNVRLSVWSSTLEMISEKPLLGVGPGQFEVNFPRFESTAHKEMLVAAHTTEHPHNEILYIASECGVPVALLWCLLVGFTLIQRPKTALSLAASTGLFILFIQGMMDKPLFQQPSMLFFYVLIALVWAENYKVNWPEIPSDKWPQALTNTTALLLLGLGLFFSFKETIASLNSRAAIRQANKSNYGAAYQLINKGIEQTPWKPMLQYRSFMYAVKNLRSTDAAQSSHTYLSEKAPFFRNFSLIEADYYEQLSHANSAQKNDLLELAMKSYNKACQLHSSDVLGYYDRVNFCIRARSLKELGDAQLETESLYERKYQRYLNDFQIADFNGQVKQWLKGKTYGELLNGAKRIMLPLKPAYTFSPLFPQKYRALIPILGGGYNIGDMHYIMDFIKLSQQLPSKGSIEESCNNLLTQIQTIPGDSFSWPRQTLKQKKGTALAKLCLISTIMKLQKVETAIFLQSGQWRAFCYTDKEFWLIENDFCKKISISHFQKQFPKVSAKSFQYPQAYFLKNEFFNHVLSESQIVPYFSRNPAYGMRLFNSHFSPKEYQISPLEAPFEELYQKTKVSK